MAENQIFQQRQTAFKMWIGDVVSSKFEKQEGDMPLNYVDFNGVKVARVNIIANVISKTENDEKTYLEVTLDDGTGNVRLKTWRDDSDKLRDVNIGDSVLVIGKPRAFDNEIYVVPEIVRVLDDLNWFEVRKLELKKDQGEYTGEVKKIEETPAEQKVIVEEIVEPSESSRARILGIIEKNSSEDGAELDIVVSSSGLSETECNEVINDLLKEGEIFSPRPGKVKMID